jgi:hypothetical protein
MNQTNPFEESERKCVADVSAFLRENPEIRSEIEDQDCTEFPPKDDREKTNSERNWPDPPDPQAYYGLAGDIVRTIEPHTESSSVALLIQTLVCFGNLIGRTAHFVAEGSQHFLNLFVVLVGVTSVGRKGSSWSQILRAAPQTMRLACLYALLDQPAVVKEEHLLAAVALWEYCHNSARFIFGDALGDPTADAILRALREEPDGLDRTSISSLFSRHASAGEISRALSVLQEHGLAVVNSSQNGTGRPSEVWTAVGSTAKNAK